MLEAITKKAAKRELQVNLVILAGLVAFSIWNQLNYLLGAWRPATNNVIALPDWVAYGIRASAAPLFFMAAAFLARQAESLGEHHRREPPDAPAVPESAPQAA